MGRLSQNCKRELNDENVPPDPATAPHGVHDATLGTEETSPEGVATEQADGQARLDGRTEDGPPP